MAQVSDNHQQLVGSLDEEFGVRVRLARMAKRLSQGEVADTMNSKFSFGWHPTTVSRIESSDRPAKLKEAVALALVLDVGLEDLVFGGTSSIEAVTAADRAYEELSHVQEIIEKRMLRLRMEATDVVVEHSRRRTRTQES